MSKPPFPAPRRPHKTELAAAVPDPGGPALAALAQAPVAGAPLRGGRLLIGREGADLVLDSPIVSRRHALVENVAGRCTVRDLGSLNGLFVGPTRARAAQLVPGSVFRIGPFLLRYDGTRVVAYDSRGAVRLDGLQLTKRVSSGKLILRDVSLALMPRQLVALVGGSGAGKSTLMKALSGQSAPTSGAVRFNGDDLYQHFDLYRSLIGYVPQDDIVHRELPVRRALAYTARLRLPPDMSRAEIRRRIERALAEVDLREHGDKRLAELSGGQRKRVSIAVELLADPQLFFLDEPTSGLDPGLEKKLMHQLRRLAEGGRTVVVVTHSTASLEQCHQIGFVADGRLVYFGPPQEALRFFQVKTGDFADVYGKLERGADAAEWEQRFRSSLLYRAEVASKLAQAPAPTDRPARAPSAPPRVSRCRQLAILSLRYLDLLVQDRKNLFVLLLQAPLIAYLMTLVAKPDALAGPKSNPWDAKTVLFMLATVAVWFGVINAAREITKEAAIWRRERLAGLRIGPYLASKLLVLGALVAAQSAALIGIVGQQVAFPTKGMVLAGPAELYLTTLFTGLSALTLGLAVSALAKTPDRAISAVPLLLIPQILFSGVLFPLGGEQSTIRVLSWLTISRWATDAYTVTVNLARHPAFRKVTEYAHTEDNLVTKWGLLGAFAAGCVILAAVVLLRRDRDG